MAIKHNNVVPNVHFRKWWQRYVKSFFNQAGKKKSRRVKRQQKAAAAFPKPTGGLLRPAVHPPTVRYNFKLREGRGFTIEELKKAGIPLKKAMTIGISVDKRRKSISEEALNLNVARLEEYKSKMVLFPKGSKAKKGDTPRSELKDLTQNILKSVLPLPAAFKAEKPRAITAEEKATSAYRVLRKGYAEKKNFGKMIKIARAKADNEKNK